MKTNTFKNERDALCFLGLFSNMYAHFDQQIIGPDNEPTHTHGLNVHSLIIDNSDGSILGMQQNLIHHRNNPLLHAEFLTLKEAIDVKNSTPRVAPNTVSTEGYYRNLLFNDPLSNDTLKSGATIYTTLEPCPFCTSALLLSRMKRIVFITPDNFYGNSFHNLRSTYYNKHDVHYERFSLDTINSEIVTSANNFFLNFQGKIGMMTGVPSTLYFDSMYSDLKIVSDYFKTVDDTKLITTGKENEQNSNLLENLQYIINSRPTKYNKDNIWKSSV